MEGLHTAEVFNKKDNYSLKKEVQGSTLGKFGDRPIVRRLVVSGYFVKPYKFRGFVGIPLRGAFGVALKRIYCRYKRFRARDCKLCRERYSCGFYYLFETRVDIIPEHLRKIARKYRRITNPFTLDPPINLSGGGFSFAVNLIGPRAFREELQVIKALILMSEMGIGYDKVIGEKRKFRLLRIDAVNPLTGYSTRVFDEGGYRIESLDDMKAYITTTDLFYKASSLAESQGKVLTLKFKTPVMLTYGGEPVLAIEVHHLIRNLVRKLSIILNYHFEMDPLRAEEAKEIIKVAMLLKPQLLDFRSIYLRRFSMKRQRWEKYGPFVRGISVNRIPEGFWDQPRAVDVIGLLILGLFLHAGKFTSAGCGIYDMRIV